MGAGKPQGGFVAPGFNEFPWRATHLQEFLQVLRQGDESEAQTFVSIHMELLNRGV